MHKLQVGRHQVLGPAQEESTRVSLLFTSLVRPSSSEMLKAELRRLSYTKDVNTNCDHVSCQASGSQTGKDVTSMRPVDELDGNVDLFHDYSNLERLFTSLQDDDNDSSPQADDTLLSPRQSVDCLSLPALNIDTTHSPEDCFADLSVQGTGPAMTGMKSSNLFVLHKFIAIDIPNPTPFEKASLMEKGGCFHLPPKAAMDEFMKQYFLYVHAFMPLIDEGDFWDAYSGRESTNTKTRSDYSLFVIQAMLFMSCPFVSTTTLTSLGLPSVRAARETFYYRAKALFDSNFCQDKIAKAQGALMLTYHADHAGELISTYWLDTAIHFAREADADRPCDPNADISPIGRVRKRLWWCCVLRDSIMSLGLRRRLSITPSRRGNMSDYALTEDYFKHEIWNSQVCTPDEKQVLIRLFMTLCKLSIILTDVLELLYPTEDDNPVSTRPSAEDRGSAKALMVKLDLWCEAVRGKLQVRVSSYEGRQDSIKLLSNALYIYYHSARIALLNHMNLISVERCDFGDDDSRVTQRWVESEVNISFRCINFNLGELQERSLVQFLPNTFIALLAFPFVWYTLGAEAMRPAADSDEILTGLNTILFPMTVFGSLYQNGDHLLQCIGKLVSSARSAKVAEKLFPRLGSRPAPEPQRSIEMAAGPSSDSPIVDQQHLVHDTQDTAEGHRYYLWLTLSVDYALCHGNLPNVVDFPRCLQRSAQAITIG
ncbi:putative Zn(2)-C6 fungal-type domain-containing protein [Seiridium unicorne]|uniref:Zn(2)-C6 fungal-type domain-containing protein n=1 Tax=Seiridium unicorne TaxID=138068 RepID=A0ABR2UW03_9PEZI